jgi:hypothetical protein
MKTHRTVSIVVWLLAFALLAGAWQVPQAAAGEKIATALDLVPENAAFYWSALRGHEQWEAVAKSRAWAKLKGLPVVKMGQGLWAAQAALNAESPPAKIEAALNDPEVRKLLDLGLDMIGQEVFLCGEASVADALELLQGAANSARFGPALAKLSGEGKNVDPGKLRVAAMISALAENTSLIKVPEMMVGFKVKNTALAKEQLARLDKLVSQALDEEPELKQRWKKTAVAGHQYLTLTLDGSMIPWGEVPMDNLKEFEEEKGDMDKIVARVKQLKLVVAVGLRGDYLLASIGPSTEALARLGTGKTLSGRPELAPLKKFAGERLTSVAYASKAFKSQLGTTKQDVDNLREMLEGMLPLMEAPKPLQDDLRKDMAAMAKDFKGLVSEQGAGLAFSFLTADGSESYSYDWSEHRELEASKPLTLLEHIGGNPTLAVVSRTKVSVEGYNLLSKWVGVAYGYAEKYAVPQMKEKERAQFRKFMADALPLVKRFDEANRRLLLPALADGQTGLVIDTKLTSKQYVKVLPPTEQALPMIEPALVFGVSDAALLRKALVEYRAVADGLLAAARKIEGNQIPPEYKIPDARKLESTAGEIYGYALPKEWGVDAKIMPNGGLSEKVAVLSLSRDQTERLLKATPPTLSGRSLPTNRPLAGAAVVDIAALIDAVAPWVDLAIEKGMEGQEGGPIDAPSARRQAQTVLEVLKVFRSVCTVTYLEGKAVVSHTRTEIRDVK